MAKLTRREIMHRAIHDCMKEMYEKAQPSADWDNIVAEYQEGKIGKDERIFERHYLSHKEFKYIMDKYLEAYGFKRKWVEYINILRDYLVDGGTTETCLKDTEFDTPYRGYEKVPPIKTRITNLLKEKYNTTNDEMVEDITNEVLDSVDKCKNFYRFEHEESDFEIAVALGASPTSNPKTVKKWWKENYNQDIEIVERNPNLLWDMDEYGDDFEQVMISEHGENWKEITDKEWHEQEAKEKAEQEEKLAKLRAKMEEEEQP